MIEHVFASRDQLFAVLAEEIARRLGAALARRGKASLILSGGTSPRDFYPLLAAQSLDWRRVEVTLSDERWVANTDPDSNEKMVRQHFPAPAQFLPFKTEDADPRQVGPALDAKLRALPRPFDVCLLGLGTDGHVAGIVPGFAGFDRALDSTNPSYVGVLNSPDAKWLRVTLTLRALLDSAWIAILCFGSAKADVYRAALKGGFANAPIGVLAARDTPPVHVFWAP